MINSQWIDIAYIVASVLFIFGLKMLSRPTTARRGNLLSALGMLIAIVVTLFNEKILTYEWILVGLVLGALLGATVARLVKMTSMPEMVAIFNGFGGLASLLVGWGEYQMNAEIGVFTAVAVILAVGIGGLTFTGSLIAYGRLAEVIDSKPTLFRGQHLLNLLAVTAMVVIAVIYILNPEQHYPLFLAAIALAFVLGVLVVIPVGGADMPVVIALLNSYSGLAACAAGFVIMNNVLIVAGALVGASGLILTNIMCKAMNRSLANVMFAGVGAGPSGAKASYKGEARTIVAEDAYLILEAARSVVFVPGYGMAVAQAQHVVRELAEMLEANGAEVKHCIHPVAGRMPGHMNVLLAEANVEYEALVVPDDVNPTMGTVDVAIVVGANDVVNPAARTDKESALYGMPIIDVDHAHTCIVLKRSLRAGFAGVDNPLFFATNTRMLLGDAKASIAALVAEFKDS